MTTKIKIIIEENGEAVMGQGVEITELSQSKKDQIMAHMVSELDKAILTPGKP